MEDLKIYFKILTIGILIVVFLLFNSCKTRQYTYSEQTQTSGQTTDKRIDSLFSEQNKQIEFNFISLKSIVESFIQNFKQSVDNEKRTYNTDGTLASEEITKTNTTIDTQKNTTTEQKTEGYLTVSDVQKMFEKHEQNIISEFRKSQNIDEKLIEKPMRSWWYIWLIVGVVIGILVFASGQVFFNKLKKRIGLMRS